MKKALIPLIAVAVFLLIVIGAGVTALTVQIRKNSPPTFTETDRYLRLLPASTGWTFVGLKAERPTAYKLRGWWSALGIRRQGELRQTTYTFSHYESTGRGQIILSRVGEKIVRFQVKGSFDEQAEDLGEVALRQFPKLQPVYHQELRKP